MLDTKSLEALLHAAQRLDAGFGGLPEFASEVAANEKIASVLAEVAERLTDNYPYFHPLYAGQMLKPPHPVARLAYSLAQYINPNNHALDGGRASSAMERDAVAEIAAMFGWAEHLGHLTGGGTMANLEALWVAGQLAPGKTIVASEQAHYTHQRISAVLQLKFEAVACDGKGRMNADALAKRAKRGDIGCVVATMGTTGTGSVDPLEAILEIQEEHGFRIHADAAYGGYFRLAENLESGTRREFAAMERVDSIVVDPHKHGLQPYGCGSVLFRDPGVGRLYKHDSPYTYFSSQELHLGEISLECSRPGAAAVALWATQRLLPLVRGGEFGKGLEKCRRAAIGLYERIRNDAGFVAALAPELDIVVFAAKARKASESSALARRIFEGTAKRGLHLALVNLKAGSFRGLQGIEWDEPTITCLRSVLMKPEHEEWVERIWEMVREERQTAGSLKDASTD